MTRLGIVTGVQAESRLIETAARRAGRSAPAIFCAGADAGRAEAGAVRLIAGGAELIVSFGVCGGLDPALRPGAPMVAETIRDGGGVTMETEPAARARLFEALFSLGLRPVGGTLFGSDAPVAGAVEKARLHADTGARAVDMESHGVARAAAKAGVPFMVLRAVADPAERGLPRAALAATAPDGGVRAGAAIAALIRRPWELSEMVRLARDARLGFATLERALPALLGGG